MMERNTKQKKKATLRIDQYKTEFLQSKGVKARDSKTAYISTEFHEKLSLIVFMMGGGKLTITDYLHNVLKYHFEDFGEELTAIYNAIDKPKL